MRCVNSEHIALPIFLLRYGSHGTEGAGRQVFSRRRRVASSPGYQIAQRCIPGKRQRHRGIQRGEDIKGRPHEP